MESYKELITAAKEKAIYVKVSSICPRSDETVNAGLVSLCADEDVTFVDNTTSFFLADKTINDGYIMYDGVHLTRSGTNKLAKNLGLSMKDSSKGVCVYHKNLKNQSTKNTEQMNNYDHNHNDDDTHADTEQFGHTFWNKAQQKAVRPQAPTRKPQQTTHFRPNMNNNNNNNNNNRQQAQNDRYGNNNRQAQNDRYGNNNNNNNNNNNANNMDNDNEHDAYDRRCYNCYETNHLSRTCKFVGPVECYKCHMYGHKAKHHTD